MYNPNRNNYENHEDWESTPAGRAMLKMDWIWEPDEYPKKAGSPATATADTEIRPDPVTAPAPAGLFVENPLQRNMEQWQKDMDRQLKTFSQPELKPDASPLHQPVTTKTGPFMQQAGSWPYNDMGKLFNPASDAVIGKVTEPAAAKLMQSVKEKQPVETMPYAGMVDGYAPVRQAAGKMVREKQPFSLPEEDLLHTAGAVKNLMGDTYTGDHFARTMNAAAYGESLGHQTDMENPDPDALKGFRNTRDEGMLSLGAVRQMGNRLIDPEGKYLPTKAFGQWIKDEENRLAANPVPELADFMKLNWKENPDEVIRLGGKYFRESLLGTHLFGFAADAMKGRAGPVANQIVATVSGIARFYNATDDIMASLSRGTAASAAENRDYAVR